MQKHEKRNRRIKTTLGVTGALAGATLTGAALIGASSQHAAEPRRASATEFPFTTLKRTQKMHLNAANVTADAPDGGVNPPDTTPPCRVLFRLFDSEGHVVATATSMLEAGKTGQLVFVNPPNIVDPPNIIPGLRGELRVSERCSDAILGSMEIIDTTSGEVRAIIAPTKSLRVAVTTDTPDTTPQ
jgi:hypothetical protein